MSERLEYSRFTLLDLSHGLLDEASSEPFISGASSLARSINVLDEPAAQAWFEDWFVDNDVEWTCWTHELHVVISGTAEITYWNPPSWETTGTAMVTSGSIYLVPRGCKFRARVTSDEPFRHITFDFPNPGFPV